MKKKVLSLVMTAILTVAMCVPAMAAPFTGSNWDGIGDGAHAGNTFDGTEYGGAYSEDGSGKVMVYANIESTYVVTVPSSVTLSKYAVESTDPAYNVALEGKYVSPEGTAITCFGNISPVKKVQIQTGGTDASGVTAADGNKFAMIGVADPTIKVDADITMAKKLFVLNNSVTGYDADSMIVIGSEGSPASAPFSVTAALEKADTYNGNMTVTFGLVNL